MTTPTPLVESKALETTLTTQYTANNGAARIDAPVVSNTTGGAIAVTLHLVPPGGTAGAGNKLVSAVNVSAGGSYALPEIAGQVLAPGGLIAGFASAAGLVLRVSGREFAA